MVHSFRIPQRVDYIKLPCLRRSTRDGYCVKYLGLAFQDVLQLRSDLIQSAISHFKPDLMLVDKKPFGVEHELEASLHYLRTNYPNTKLVLLLRDILDSAEPTRKVWEVNGYHEAIRSFYDLVLVLGLPEVFDPRSEYHFPRSITEKIRFCGYVRREPGRRSRDAVRASLHIEEGEKLVLVTPGGGEDGYHLLNTYLEALSCLAPKTKPRSHLVSGPEMSEPQRIALQLSAAKMHNVTFSEFTDDLMSYMDAADLVVSMGGYNAVCEVLTLKKPAIIVPRVRPVEEQWIRAERMARLGLFEAIHPDDLTPQILAVALLEKLHSPHSDVTAFDQLDLGALPRITYWLNSLADNQCPRNGTTWEAGKKQGIPAIPSWIQNCSKPAATK